jgi:hypothetical protein
MRSGNLTGLHRKGGGLHRNNRGGPYNHRRWRRRRRYQLAQEPLCQRCKAVGLVVVAYVVHHVEDHAGDPIKFWYGKLESLCRPCHERLHGRANDNPWIGEDGLPVSPAEQAEREREHMAKLMQWEIDNDD